MGILHLRGSRLSVILFFTFLSLLIFTPCFLGVKGDEWGAPVQLTHNTASDSHPRISRDGAKIAFQSNVDGDWEIFVVNSDGSELRQLTTNTADDTSPSISQDGSKIAFQSNVDGDWEIFVVNSDGSELRQLTGNVQNDEFPSISGDGSKVAFQAYVAGDYEVFVINSDGTNLRKLTDNSVTDYTPSISWNGSMIAFNSQMWNGDEIFIVNLDGMAWPLTFDPYDDDFPCISGDGSKVVFQAHVDGDYEVFVVNSDGGGLLQLTHNRGAVDVYPSVGFDGSKVAFQSDVDGDSEIFIINSDGTTLRQLTSNTYDDFSPSISGDGSKVAFFADVNGDSEIFLVGPEGEMPVIGAPDASFSSSHETRLVNEPVSFDGSSSSDSNGNIENYEWNFGDGTTGTGVSATHAYGSAGTYSVVLTVTDNDGLKDTATVVIIVEGGGAFEFPYWILIPIIVVAIVAVVVVWFFLKKRKPKERKPIERVAEPAKIRMTVDPTEILADGKSTAKVTVELLDEEGKAVSALVDTEISLFSSMGKLRDSLVRIPIGKGSGQTVLVSSKEGGTVTLSADAKGLGSAVMTLVFTEKKRYCMHCGAKVHFTAKRCPECDRSPPAGVDTKTCKNCDAVIPVVAKFCGECGARQPD